MSHEQVLAITGLSLQQVSEADEEDLKGLFAELKLSFKDKIIVKDAIKKYKAGEEDLTTSTAAAPSSSKSVCMGCERGMGCEGPSCARYQPPTPAPISTAAASPTPKTVCMGCDRGMGGCEGPSCALYQEKVEDTNNCWSPGHKGCQRCYK